MVLLFLLFTSRTVITTIRTMITNSSNTTEEPTRALSLEEESGSDVLQDPEGRKVSHQLYVINISSEILYTFEFHIIFFT